MGLNAAMVVAVKGVLNDKELLHVAYRLASTFGHENFGVGGNLHCLRRVVDECRYTLGEAADYDTEGIDWNNDFPLIEVFLGGHRYYGEGYSRGNILLFINIAEWLERSLPVVRVFYGASDFGHLYKFGYSERLKLKEFFFDNGHADYGLSKPAPNTKLPEECSLCHQPLLCVSLSGDGHFAVFYCSGCGKTVRTEDFGKTYEIQK